MKKIIILLMILPNIVFAETIYTEYESYLVNSNDYLEENDIIKREEVKIYNTYIKQIEEKYAKLGELDNFEVDYKDYFFKEEYTLRKEKDFQDYQLKCLNDNNNLNLIKLNDFSTDIKINEIEIISNDEPLDYNADFACFSGNTNLLFDKDTNGNGVIFRMYNGSIFLRFSDGTKTENVKVKFYIPKQDLKNISFNLFLNEKYQDRATLELEENESTIVTLDFDKLYNEFLEENNFITSSKCLAVYQNKIPFYKHTKTTIIPQNKYLELNNKDLFIMSDYQIRYNYQKREKIEIKDNWYLKNDIFNIKNYINSSTISLDKLYIIDNIDYSKSGTYLISIYYNDTLLLEKEIFYENTDEAINEDLIIEKDNNVNNETSVKNKTNKIFNTKNQKTTTSSITTKSSHATKNKEIYKLNNQQKTNSDKQTKFYILVVSILIISLALFEMCLLYVKRKYF